MGSLNRQVLLHPGEDGWWVAEVPSLPGCIGQGRDQRDALQNIREAIELYIEVLEEDGQPVPPEDYLDARLVKV